MSSESAIRPSMTRAERRQIVWVSMGFMLLCLVVGAFALRHQLAAWIARVTDYSPPHATFAFRTTKGGISQGTVIVKPGEAFVPLLNLRDNVDASPVASAWLTPAGVEEVDHDTVRSVTLGSPMAIDEPGLWHIHARVTDASGNSSTWGAVISVFSDLPLADSSETDRLVHADRESDATATVRSDGVRVVGMHQATSLGVAAVIEELRLTEDRNGLRSIEVTVLVGSVHDLTDLDRSHVSLVALDETHRPIPPIGWTQIPERNTEHLPEDNLWRLWFDWEYEQPLPQIPASLRISFAVRNGDRRNHYFADTDGLHEVPNPIESVETTLSAGKD